MAEMGMTSQPTPSPRMALWLVPSVLAAWVIAMTYGWAQGAGAGDGITIGLMLALPTVAVEIAGGLAMTGRSMAYILTQSGYALVGYALAGAIIGIM